MIKGSTFLSLHDAWILELLYLVSRAGDELPFERSTKEVT
jgi:hypothetical protein